MLNCKFNLSLRSEVERKSSPFFHSQQVFAIAPLGPIIYVIIPLSCLSPALPSQYRFCHACNSRDGLLMKYPKMSAKFRPMDLNCGAKIVFNTSQCEKYSLEIKKKKIQKKRKRKALKHFFSSEPQPLCILELVYSTWRSGLLLSFIGTKPWQFVPHNFLIVGCCR